MILTGKAKEHFEKWLEEGNHTPWVAFFYNLPDTVMYAYYHKWFDSVGYYIDTPIWHKDNVTFFGFLIYNDFKVLENKDGVYDTRNEATKAAILTCNNLYNER